LRTCRTDLLEDAYLDGVVGEVEEPEAHDVDGGGGPPGAGERAAVLLGVAEVAPDVRREADHQHLAGAPTTSQSVTKSDEIAIYCR
jgi:hypothetical protein